MVSWPIILSTACSSLLVHFIRQHNVVNNLSHGPIPLASPPPPPLLLVCLPFLPLRYGQQSPFDYSDIVCTPTSCSSETARYRQTLKTTTNVSGDYLTQMGNWVRAVPERAPSLATQQLV